MSLLDTQGMQPPQMTSSLLSPAMPQQGQAPQAGPGQGGANGLQMAMQLSQNPTPQVANQIVQQLRAMGNPQAAQFQQMFEQTGGDPARLKQLADAIVQKLGGQQQ